MNTSLVTGGAGFIGSHLVETLLAAGRRVIVIDDLSTGTLTNLARVQTHPGLRIVTGTITNEPLIESLIHEADVIYHLAAVVGVCLILEVVKTVEMPKSASSASPLALKRMFSGLRSR